MSNHFHLIARTPDGNLAEGMRWFMLETSRELVRKGNRINQTYGGPYYRSILRSHTHYLHAYKYLYHNPIRANICSNVMDYPYSTLLGLIGKAPLLVPVSEDLTLFSDVEGTIKWLNKVPEEHNWRAVGSALRKQEFKLARKCRKPHPLDSVTL